MRHPASGDNHSMPDLAHDTRQSSEFSTSAAMYKNTARPTVRWTVAGDRCAADGVLSS
jgi:hypothetical protein